MSGYEEMPADLQAKVLRVLESGHFRPLGSPQDVQSSFRLISLFRDNAEDMVARNQLRRDLYFRLNVITLKLPALSQRHDDIWPLACYFAQNFGREISSASRSYLESEPWPGNLRELRNRVERAHVLQETGPLNLAPDDPSEAKTSSTLRSLEEVMQEHVHHILKVVNGNKSQAAKILGISRRTLYTYLKDENSD